MKHMNTISLRLSLTKAYTIFFYYAAFNWDLDGIPVFLNTKLIQSFLLKIAIHFSYIVRNLTVNLYVRQ